MEFKKKYPCTQCIFLTTKESTLAKHMKRHQNVTSKNTSKRIFNVYSEEFKNLRRKNNKHENNITGGEEENFDCESGHTCPGDLSTSM